MTFPQYLLYPTYTAVIGLVMLAVVPKGKIRQLVPFAVLFGGLGDFLWLLLLGFLGIGGYINFGPFGFLGMPFFPPLAWTFFFIIYLYLLPDKFPWNYIFTLAGAGYSLVFSNVLQNLGIFQWRAGRFWVPFLIYVTWMLAVTYTYQYFFKDTKTHI